MKAEDQERLWAAAGDYAALAAKLRINHSRDYADSGPDCRVCSTVERLATESLVRARSMAASTDPVIANRGRAPYLPGAYTTLYELSRLEPEALIDRTADPSAASPTGVALESERAHLAELERTRYLVNRQTVAA